MKNYKLGILALAAFAISCGSEDSDVTDIPEIDSLATIDSTEVLDNEILAMYSVPTPGELFSFIKEAGSDARGDLLNAADNAGNYDDIKSKSLNFGIYSTDLAYSSQFNMGTETLKYFSCVNKLGDELEISAAFDESMVDRIKKNINNADSLLAISDDTYYSAYDYLVDNDRGAVLAMVVAGGWIESMYITTNLVDAYTEDNPTIERIAEQRYSLDHLMLFLEEFGSDENVASTLGQLQGLHVMFENIEEVEVESSETSSSGRMVLGGGGGTTTKHMMSEAQLKEITEKIASIRNSITGTNS